MPTGLPTAEVVLLTRAGCHLCDQAEPVVREQAAAAGADVVVLDVDQDPALRERYTDHVPVLFVRGRLAQYWTVDPQRLAGALAGEDFDEPVML